MREFTLSEAVKFFSGFEMARATKKGEEEALEVAAAMIADRAKKLIGTYDAKPRWPELAESTQADRAQKGFPPNEPLLRTGELRDSIGFEIIKPGREAIVGSTSDIAVYQELGTSTIPPRSFLVSAAVSEGKKAARVAGAIVADAIAETRLFSSEFGELIHILRELGHETKKDIERAVESKDHHRQH